MAKLYRVILPVTDIEKAVSFWSQLFEINGTHVSPGRHYFDCEGTILACYDPIADGDDTSPEWTPHFNQYLYFAVDDLENIHRKVIQSGVSDVTDIEVMPWGERMFYTRDPFDNPISFVDRSTMFTGTD